MRCQRCGGDYLEEHIDESHDVPCYLFIEFDTRQQKKNKADKLGRHHLCKVCHKMYEIQLNNFLKLQCQEFAKRFFI